MASVGETLRSAREQRGLTIEQVSHDTRISGRFLEALEGDRHHELPAPVYVRGFIRSYASYLKLDGNELLSQLPTATGGGGAAAAGAAGVAATMAGAGAQGARSLDPFRRPAPPPPRAPDPDDIDTPIDDDFYSRETIRRPVDRSAVAAVAAVGAIDEEYDDDTYAGRGGAVLLEDERRGGISRTVVLAGIALLGLGIAVVTGILVAGGDDDGVTTALSGDDASPTREGGSVVVVGSQTPGASPSVTVNQPGAPSGGTQTPTGSPVPDSEGSGEGETATATEEENEEDATPTVTAGAETPTVTVTSIPTLAPTPTATTPPQPTPFPTPTPTVFIQAHPASFSDCPGGDCGPPPLRVICPPDGIWFVDANKDYANPGWPENTSAITTTQAAQIGAAGCQ